MGIAGGFKRIFFAATMGFGCLMATTFSVPARAVSFGFEFPKDEFQGKVKAMAAARVSKKGYALDMSKLEVSGFGPEGKVEMTGKFKASAPGLSKAAAISKSSGVVRLSARMEYEPKGGVFRLGGPEVSGVESKDLLPEHGADIEELALAAAAKMLASRPIYILDDAYMKSRLAAESISQVGVSKNALQVVFGQRPVAPEPASQESVEPEDLAGRK